MKKAAIALLLLLLTNYGFGQITFAIKNGSKIYAAEISIENCDNDNCEGKGVIKLFDKKTARLFQTLTSDDLYFFLDSAQKSTTNIVQLYGEQSPLQFDDFNFDGTEDLAVRNGNNSGYGGPSYDVYVYNATKNQFVLSRELTTLTIENLGMFRTDKRRKRLITYAKAGCCWHITTEYDVVPNKGLQKVYEFEEKALDGEFVTVTTRNLRNGKWVSRSKKYKVSDYYKEQKYDRK